MMVAAVHSEVKGNVAQLRMIVDQQYFFPLRAAQVHGQMDRQCGGADTALCSEERQDLARIEGTSNGGRPAAVEPGDAVGKFVTVERLGQEFAVPGAHGVE